MMLFEKLYEPCVMMEHQSEPDGSGGSRSHWVPGEEFMAAVVMDKTSDGTVADSRRAQRTFTVTMPFGTKLGFHDVFKRVSDGQCFIVTSLFVDRKTPYVATFEFEQVTAEAWEVPDE